jgi:hypothetical protein
VYTVATCVRFPAFRGPTTHVLVVDSSRVLTYPQLDGLTGPALTYAVSVVSADTLIAVMLTWLLRKAQNLSRAGRAGDPFASQVDGVVHRLVCGRWMASKGATNERGCRSRSR